MIKKTKSLQNRTFQLLPVLLIGFLLSSVSAEQIEDETCLNCHDGYKASLSMTAHNNLENPISCISCHGEAASHSEDPTSENIINPATLSSSDADLLCSGCHQPHRGSNEFGYNSHRDNDVSCFSCHKIHSSDASMLLDREAAFCLSCHVETKAAFTRRSQHPVEGGFMTCLSCHEFSTKVNNEMAYDNSRLCRDCHPHQAGPFLHEHDAANAYSLEGSGCVECHEPHGSENNFLLKQPGNNLCNSCHFVPGHQLAHPNRNYNELNCVECHTGSHGSHESNLLLDPDLPAKFADNCYQSGCHSLNR